MNRLNRKKIMSIFLVIGIVLFLMTGCQSSDSNSDNTEADSTSLDVDSATNTITGTAAAGAAIVGMVNVKGAAGNTASAEIDTDGHYELDVSELTAPYVLCAWGTVNGESTKLYSAGVEAGNINITPITNMIMAKVLGQNPDDAYDNWTSAGVNVDQEALDSAESTVREQLRPILEAAGVSADSNLMSAVFDPDHTGLDAVLDVLEITIGDDNIITVTNRQTGTKITGDEVFTDDEKTAIEDILNEAGNIGRFWTLIGNLNATGKPTASEINSKLAPLIADGMINNGGTKSDWLDNMATNGFPTGIVITTSIKDPISKDTLGDSYEKGYWVNLHFAYSGLEGDDKTMMVYDGSNWLWYGNQRWVDAGFSWVAVKNRGFEWGESPDGKITYISRLYAGLRDNYNYAYNQGVEGASVFGPYQGDWVPGEHHLKSMLIGFPDSDFSNSETDFKSDDTLSGIIENSNFAICLIDDESSNPHGVVQAFELTVPGKPFLPSEITADMFPVITKPTSGKISELNIGGDVEIAWKNIDNCKIKWSELCWGGNDQSICQEKIDIDLVGKNSIIYDTSSNDIDIVDWGWLVIECQDMDGRLRRVEWGGMYK